MNVSYLQNPNGPTLGYCDVPILQQDGLFFKNLSRTGNLLPYEDWRRSPEERTEDLVKRLSLQQMAGLIMHRLLGAPNSGGDDYEESFIHAFGIMDGLVDVEDICAQRNEIQEKMESLPFGIPALITDEGVNYSDDSVRSSSFRNAGDLFSKWPEPLGIAATFDPKYALGWGTAASREYRATGITVALEPQIDVATEPRWNRFYQTFGEGVKLVTDMGRAFIDGLQTSEGDREIRDGWGYDSVCATPKHFPGGATGESGRDAHFNYGKYAVYPGGNFEMHLKPFAEGAFQLNGPTKSAAYIMPYYTVSYGQDPENGENVGNGFSSYMLQTLLRKRLGFTEGIFSDFGITPEPANGTFMTGRCWGIEEYSDEAKRLKGWLAGICTYGADDDFQSMQKAVSIAVERYGEAYVRGKLEETVKHMLLHGFKQGMFENPYLDADRSAQILADQNARMNGYEAQLKSLILLKNTNNTLPISERKKVYIPNRTRSAQASALDLRFAVGLDALEAAEYLPVKESIVADYYDLVATPEEADFAVVFMESPESGSGWSRADKEAGGNGYLPISLQYRPYTADTARTVSLAGGDLFEDFTNRSYRGKSTATTNESDLDALLNTKAQMGNKPVIAVLTFSRPTIPAEFEPYCDAIVAHSGVQTAAVMDILSGKAEPSGLLPCQMPANMETVESQFEDVPFDMECYTDSNGNTYDYAFGLNWNGVIQDWRTEKYGRI